jgi:phosphoribosyl 1,2-cyclic phosphodiesterase
VLRFSSLASGSSGNATLVEAADGERTTRLLIDCGLSLRRLTAALARRGCTPAELDAVFVTHEHSDHIGGVFTLQRRYGTPVWASRGTLEAMAVPAGAHTACAGQTIDLGALQLQPFAVPHDASEPLQLVCRAGEAQLGVVTDLGEPDDAVRRALQGCAALLLECNHDRAMLRDGPYPAWLKRRIGGLRGHLANEQSTELLAACRHGGLRHVMAAHLSRHNNQPALALAALRSALPAGRTALCVADGDHGSGWVEVG